MPKEKTLTQRLARALKNPGLILEYLYHKTFFIRFLFMKKYRWSKNRSAQGLRRKQYQTVQDYLKHQSSKLRRLDQRFLREYDRKFKNRLRKTLKRHKFVEPGMTVLCLGARQGSEVKAFLDLGCFAVGVDINPGQNNQFVLYGDFHKLQFADKTIDVVFTNSLDHAFDLKKVINEIKRVLKAKRWLILEVSKGEGEKGIPPGYYESISWQKADDILELFLKAGFRIIGKNKFQFPWTGFQFYLQKR